MSTSPVGSAPRPAGSLVGRRVEIGWLHTRFTQAMQNVPQLVLIEGEPGIGKTRLAAELLDDARRAGARVIRGRCYEHLRFTYLPLRETLFGELAAWADGRPEHGADGARLRTLLDDDAEPAIATEDAPPDLRARQLLALTRLTIAFCRDQPSVVLVDDLHWADDDTIDLLRHLLFRFEDEAVPLLVVATARTDPHAPAAAGIERIRAETRATALTVHPLAALEAAELAREIAGELPIEQARALAAASGGNPLLVEALARHAAADPDGHTPVGRAHPMTAVISADLDRLSPDAREITRVAAVLVPHCPPALLLEVSGLDAAASTALREAVDARVLVDDGDRVDFAHPLFAHLTSAQTPGSQRRTIHARVATRLLAHPDDHEVRTIAHHLVGAGDAVDRGAVAEYGRRAADLALAAAAWSDAATFYEATIAAVDAGPDERAALHRLAGLSRRGNLELAAAVTHFDAAIAALGDRGDPRTLTDLHTWRLRCGVGTPDLRAVIADVSPLESLVATIEPTEPALAADAFVELSQAYWINGDLAACEAAARHAIALAERTGAPSAISRGAMALAVPQWARYELEESLASLQHAATAQHAHAQGADRTGGPAFRIPLVLAWLGRLDDAERTAEECCEIAEAVGYPLEEGLPLAALTLAALTRGDFDRAEQYAHRALVVQRLSGYHWAAGLYQPALAQARLWRGAYDGADDALTTWGETAGGEEQALIALLRRQVDTARREIPIPGGKALPMPPAPAVGVDTWSAVTLTIAHRDGGPVDATGARDLFARMEACGGVVISGTGMLVARLRGLAAHLAGDDDGAIDALERARTAAERIGARPEHARTLVDLATIRLRRSERAEAASLLHDAVTRLETLGMYPEARRAAAVDGFRRPGNATAVGATVRVDDIVPTDAVILFTDVVDSTRLTEELGNAPYRERALRLESLLMSTIAAHHGTVVTGINLGDGLIGVFHDAVEAIRAALAVARDASRVADLHLRLGIHAGDILVDGARIYGGPVNFAARVCSLAGPDEVLVSSRVHDAVGAPADLGFVDRGEHALKGIGGPQRVYAAVAGGDVPA